MSATRAETWIVIAALALGVGIASSLAAPDPASGTSGKAKPHVVPASSPPRPASARPDFSGTWKLDVARSEFGKIVGGKPKSRTDVIEHREPRVRQTLYIDNGMGPDTTVYVYTTDSTRAVNKVDKQEIEARVWWRGRELQLDSKTHIMTFDMRLQESWSLSSDGKTLVNSRRLKYPLGEGEQRLVFVRQ